MVPLPRNTIQHFTHNHPLTQVYENKEFLCDGCKTLGFGTRYRCHDCDFDLHEHCSACPMVFSSFMHPQHNLTLALLYPQANHQTLHACDVRGDLVEGLFYRCQLCDFDVHPICTQLPEHVRHIMHPNHLLKLQSFHPGWCVVCKGMCTSWRYRCQLCCFDLHLECVLAPCDMSTPRFVPPVPLCFSSASVALPRPPYFDPYASRLFPTSSSNQDSRFWHKVSIEPCDFDLHDHFGTCPMELSSFMHEHSLKLVVRKPQATRQNERICDLCCDPVEGLFYRHERIRRPRRCQSLKTPVPPPSASRPRLSLMLIYYAYSYEAIQPTCEEATTTLTPRSLKTPAPPSSASPFFFMLIKLMAMAYGAIPPPPYFAYACGVPFAPPYFGPYAHGSLWPI
ncbi:hypothetical protein REPUB_Repub02eG0267000 [Reevesia pubescens]